jgi:hypothetical protein
VTDSFVSICLSNSGKNQPQITQKSVQSVDYA